MGIGNMDPSIAHEAFDRISESEQKGLNDLIDFYENQVLFVLSLPQPDVEPAHRIRTFALALRQICFVRSRALFAAALDAFVKDNAYAMTTLIRSHIESTALLGRVFRQLHQAAKNPSQYVDIGNSLRDHLLGSRYPDLNEKGAPTTLNVLTMIDQADSVLEVTLFSAVDEKPKILRECYDFLCEFAHPNFHSHKLAITFDSEAGHMHFRDCGVMNEIEVGLIGYASISGNVFRYLYDEMLAILPSETTTG